MLIWWMYDAQLLHQSNDSECLTAFRKKPLKINVPVFFQQYCFFGGKSTKPIKSSENIPKTAQ